MASRASQYCPTLWPFKGYLNTARKNLLQERICYFNNDICYMVCSISSLHPYTLPILLCAARTEVWNVVWTDTEKQFHVPHNQGIVLVQRKATCRICDVLWFYYNKSCPAWEVPSSVPLHQVLVDKYLMATSNVTTASQKVASKHIARIPVQGTIAICAVNMCTGSTPTS